MPEQWTADVVGKMHLCGVTGKQLAMEIGWNPKYLSQVLNGHETPLKAETKVRAALDRIIQGTEGGKSENHIKGSTC